MDIETLLRKRRSIRAFKSTPVPREQIRQLIAAAATAPTACDRQLWHFIVVDDPAIIRQLVDRGAAAFIERAPAGILVLYHNRTENTEYMDHIQSASAAIQNLLLAAASKELGTCWVCHLPSKRQLRRFFRIPRCYDPIAYIAVGYPDMEPRSKKLKTASEAVVSYNCYESTRVVDVTLRKTIVGRILLRAYFLLPVSIRKRLARHLDSRRLSEDEKCD
jgi:nitroreductase